MSEADVMTRHDLKAGFSTICRRGEHKTCATAKARCDCPCHGAPPAEVELSCDECGRTFGRPQALGRHRTAMHGAAPKVKKNQESRIKNLETGKRSAAREIPRTRPRLDSDSIRASLDPGDDYDPWVVLVGHATEGSPAAEAAIVSTKGDAEQVVRLLAAVGVKAWSFRLADANGPGS